MAKTLHPNVNAGYYDGETQISFDCPVRHISECKFAMSEIKPFPPEAECCFRVSGNCHCQAAHIPALKKLSKEINDQIKAMEDASNE